MMLREVEGAWVHVVLLGLTVAMATAADVVGVEVLLASVCFSAGLCRSISPVTNRSSDGKTTEVKQALINRRQLNQTSWQL